MRRCAVAVGLLLGLFWILPAETAQPKPKTAEPSVDGDLLRPGQFTGTLVKVPNSDRMFTLKITYPEVRLKPGAKPPTGGTIRLPHVQNMSRQFQQLHRLQQQMVRSSVPHHAIHNMMQMQQTMMQMQMNQQRMAQAEASMMMRMAQQQAKAEQQLIQAELKALQQYVKAVQNMYQVVKVTRDFDFQADENVKVRVKDLPEQFDEKGVIKKYTAQEKAEFKGKDKNLPGYESSIDALKVGQIVQATLGAHKKPRPASSSATSAAKNKDGDSDKDKDSEKESANQHKMQVKMIVILKDSASSGSATSPSANKKK